MEYVEHFSVSYCSFKKRFNSTTAILTRGEPIRFGVTQYLVEYCTRASKTSLTKSGKHPRSANWGSARANAGRKKKKLSTPSLSQAAPAVSASPVNSVGPAGPSALPPVPPELSSVPTVGFFAPRLGIHLEQTAVPMGLSNDINLTPSGSASQGDDGGMGNSYVALHGEPGT